MRLSSRSCCTAFTLSRMISSIASTRSYEWSTKEVNVLVEDLMDASLGSLGGELRGGGGESTRCLHSDCALPTTSAHAIHLCNKQHLRHSNSQRPTLNSLKYVSSPPPTGMLHPSAWAIDMTSTTANSVSSRSTYCWPRCGTPFNRKQVSAGSEAWHWRLRPMKYRVC